jgi:RNAse (barnase) inhibitor barstar
LAETREKIPCVAATMKRRYTIDGGNFSTLEEFARHFSAVVLEQHEWRGNLDSFNDILRGGFGTPDEGFVLVWRNHHRSKQCLGHIEAARRFELMLTTCHPSNIPAVQRQLSDARLGKGPTLFDELIEVIRIHGPGGRESVDGVELVFE